MSPPARSSAPPHPAKLQAAAHVSRKLRDEPFKVCCHEFSLWIVAHVLVVKWIRIARPGYSDSGLPLANSSKAARLLTRVTVNVLLAERAVSPTAKKKEAGYE
jgi:hypothetical protein